MPSFVSMTQGRQCLREDWTIAGKIGLLLPSVCSVFAIFVQHGNDESLDICRNFTS